MEAFSATRFEGARKQVNDSVANMPNMGMSSLRLIPRGAPQDNVEALAWLPEHLQAKRVCAGGSPHRRGSLAVCRGARGVPIWLWLVAHD